MYECELLFFQDGKVESRKGVLYESATFEEKAVKPKYIACPAFTNFHVHLGDSVAKDPPFSGIELVMPGGYKFRMLEKYGKECRDAMSESIRQMILSGILKAYDFREGGVEGVKMLRDADRAKICVILGRPNEWPDANEDVLSIADGFGISSVRDIGFEKACELRKLARKKGKLFFVHAGEVDSNDVDCAIELEPDALIHMNMAEERQLKRAMDEEITVVSCFRSNAFFDVLNLKNYRTLMEYERWRIGTDNVMLASPSILEEMHFASYLLRNDECVFRAATCDGFELGAVVFHRKLNFSRVRNPLAAIVRRAGMEDIECVLPGRIIFE